MLIRSQDKRILINMNNVSSTEMGDNELRIFDNRITSHSSSVDKSISLDMRRAWVQVPPVTCEMACGVFFNYSRMG